MIKEALEYLCNIRTAGRDSIVKLDDGSGRAFLYDDSRSCYLPLDQWSARARSVSNIESFTAMVIEEARRASSDGDWMTVVFSAAGGIFFPDDKDQRISFGYDRTLSPQCVLIQQWLGKPMNHRTLVSLIQTLRPSIQRYPEVLRDFRKVSFGSGVKIESEPTLQDGKHGNSYSLEVTVNSKAAGAALPSVIACEIQYARGSARRYPIDLDVDIALKDQPRELVFTLTGASMPVLAQQAIEDEIAEFREAAKALPKLCILEDY